MPTVFAPKNDLKDAKELASSFGVRTCLVRIDPIAKAFVNALRIKLEAPIDSLLD